MNIHICTIKSFNSLRLEYNIIILTLHNYDYNALLLGEVNTDCTVVTIYVQRTRRVCDRRRTSQLRSNAARTAVGQDGGPFKNNAHSSKPSDWPLSLYFFVPCRKFGSPYPGKAQQPQAQEQRYPFLSACAVFSYVQPVLWLSVLGIINVRTDVDACKIARTRKLYGHRKRVCTGKK